MTETVKQNATSKQYLYCPYDRFQLITKNGFPWCPSCGFTHWNNPAPAIAALIPVFSGDSTPITAYNVQNNNPMVNNRRRDTSIILVQRKFEPKAGGWCLPCGFINADEEPEDACLREVDEETGLKVKVQELVTAERSTVNNVTVIGYLCRIVSGKMVAGDDAAAIGAFTLNEMIDKDMICFHVHRRMILKWYQTTEQELTGVKHDSEQVDRRVAKVCR